MIKEFFQNRDESPLGRRTNENGIDPDLLDKILNTDQKVIKFASLESRKEQEAAIQIYWGILPKAPEGYELFFFDNSYADISSKVVFKRTKTIKDEQELISLSLEIFSLSLTDSKKLEKILKTKAKKKRIKEKREKIKNFGQKLLKPFK